MSKPKIKRAHGKVEFLGDEFFIVALLSREDLEGYMESPEEVSDEEMEEIARRLGLAILPCFWESLEVICKEGRKDGRR